MAASDRIATVTTGRVRPIADIYMCKITYKVNELNRAEFVKWDADQEEMY